MTMKTVRVYKPGQRAWVYSWDGTRIRVFKFRIMAVTVDLEHGIGYHDEKSGRLGCCAWREVWTRKESAQAAGLTAYPGAVLE